MKAKILIVLFITGSIAYASMSDKARDCALKTNLEVISFNERVLK